MSKYWGVRLGEGGRFVRPCYEGKFIAIGWISEKLDWLHSEKDSERAWDSLKQIFRKEYPNDSESSVGMKCGEIFRFVREFNEEDIILVPEPQERKIIIGKITGPYRFVDNPIDGCDYPHRRNVEWLKIISRDAVSQKLRNTLVWLTVVSLEDHSAEINELIQGIKVEQPEIEITGDELYREILDRLKEMDPRYFEKFIATLLGIIGFDSATPMNYVGDKGIDVIGNLNAGLTSLTLHVQVKKVSSPLGIDEVLKIRGTLGPDEHGAIITTSRFTRQAEEESRRMGVKPITLINGNNLIELILEHYDDIKEEYKNLLNISKKEIPIKEKFIVKTRKSPY